jgi:hypothetical protein
MELIVDGAHLGRSGKALRRSRRVDGLTPLNLGWHRGVILVALHRYDEVLGAGELLQTPLASHTRSRYSRSEKDPGSAAGPF